MSEPLNSREEMYDPDCPWCEQAAQDYEKLEREADDLATLVRRLVRALRSAAPANDLADKAMDYLERHNRRGEPLRASNGPKSDETERQRIDDVPDTLAEMRRACGDE